MRCFIAINIPEHIRSQIFHVFENFKQQGVCYGNFTKKENLHLTLKFLGNIPQDKIELVKNTLNKIDFRQFPVETGKIGFFPNKKYVKIIWVELVASDFDFIIKKINSELQNSELDFLGKSQKMPFVPHLTVARIKGVKNKKLFLDKINNINIKKMFFVVDTIYLVKSILKPSGPQYKIIANFPMRRRV